MLELSCRILPFYNAVTSARLALCMDADAWLYLAIISGYAVIGVLISILAFKVSRKR